MKNIIKLMVLCLTIFNTQQILKAQGISGSWEGTVSFQGTEMPLAFNITPEGDSFSATMDSPAQGAFGIPTDVSTFKNNVLTIEHKQSGFKYVGDFKGETISGILYQAGMEFPLELSPKKVEVETPKSDNSIEGSWKGTVSFQGTEMPLAFNITPEGDSFSATMDSPAQGAMGMPMDKATFADNTLKVEYEQAGLKYEGKLEGSKINGTLFQGGMEFPLTLERQAVNKTGSVHQGYNFQEVMQEKMTSNLVDRTFSKEEVAEDIDFYLKTMHEVCPNPYLNSDSLQIQKIAKEIKSMGDLDGRALHLEFLKLSSAFKAGHVYVAPPMQMVTKYFEDGGKFLPFGVTYKNGLWSVNQTIGSEAEPLQEKVIHSVNDIDVNTFLEEMKQYAHREGDLNEALGREINSFLWLKGIEPPFKVVWSNGKNAKRNTTMLRGVDILKETNINIAEEEEDITLSDFITFEMLPNKVAYLNVKSMALFDEELTKEYAPFVKNTFSTIAQKNAEHLIIDLRENSGGQGKFADEILPYFANKPYRQAAGETRRVSQAFKDFINEMPEAMRIANLKAVGIENYPDLPNGTNMISLDPPSPLKEVEHKFDGKVWCLIGPGTFSAGMMMANAIEDYDLGTLVGEPTGGIPNELSDVLPVKTPNSKIAFMAPSVIFTRANGDASNTNPVLPDVDVVTTSEDVNTGVDAPLNYVLQKIKN